MSKPYVSLAKTATDWLLERFDHGKGRPGRTGERGCVGFIRPMFQLVDDHPATECPTSFLTGNCIHLSGQASWPTPQSWEVIYERP